MSGPSVRFLIPLLVSLLVGCAAPDPRPAVVPPHERVPEWATDAIWYQIFPERFRNGDPSNDPTRETLEFGEDVPPTWEVRSWTGDWYERSEWEEEMGPDFYHDGVFHRRYGGDLQGVMDKLDYLDSLGINAIYFNPLFWARSLHKYDGNTFHHIDPHFGPDPEGDYELIASEDPLDPTTWKWTTADKLFLELLRRAKEREIRIIIDGVFNHTGRDFFAFADLRQYQENSRFRDWYVVHSFDDPDDADVTFSYDGWWGIEHLPEFALNEAGDNLHPEVKEYIFHATARWMDPSRDGDPSDGIDGWRLDVAEEVPAGFWNEWNQYVRSINPEAYTVSEVWTEADAFVREGGFSATMNYWAFAHPVKEFMLDSRITAAEFASQLENRRLQYPNEVAFALQNLMDSHDTDRLASMVTNRGQAGYNDQNIPRDSDGYDIRKPSERERNIQRLVALFQMTYVGAPMIYYGTEAGMWGADDPDCRMPMVWFDYVFEPQRQDPRNFSRDPDEITFDHELFEFYRDIIGLRNDHVALRRGDLEFLFTDDAARTVAFIRTLDEDRMVILINRGDEPVSVNLGAADLGGADGRLIPVFGTSDRASSVLIEDGSVTIRVTGLTGVLYRVEV